MLWIYEKFWPRRGVNFHWSATFKKYIIAEQFPREFNVLSRILQYVHKSYFFFEFRYCGLTFLRDVFFFQFSDTVCSIYAPDILFSSQNMVVTISAVLVYLIKNHITTHSRVFSQIRHDTIQRVRIWNRHPGVLEYFKSD